MRKILAAVSAAAFLSLGVAPVYAAPNTGQQTCPAVAVVAARGSEESVELGHTRYAADSPWESNGYEGYQIGTFLRYAENRHVEQTGESLLADVPVIALDADVYPAAFPMPVIAEEGEQLAAREVLQRVGALLNRVSAPQIARISFGELARSVRSGTTGTMAYLAGWEEATGCSPQYILVGYSQGAVVLTAQEHELAEQGRLAGALYLGNPWVRAGEPSIVGGASPGGGLLQYVPAEWERTAAGVPRVNYCLPADLACDTSMVGAVDSAEDSAQTGGFGAHTDYFTGEAPAEHDAAVADVFASWIHEAEGR